MLMTLLSALSTRVTLGASGTQCANGCRSFHCRCIRRRPACLSSDATRRPTANGVGSANRRPSTFWIHPHLRQVASGKIPPQATVPPRSHEGETQGGCRRVATANASVNPRARDLAEASCHWLLCLPRCPDELGGAGGLSGRHYQEVVVDTPPPQPEECPQLDPNEAASPIGSRASGRLAP